MGIKTGTPKKKEIKDIQKLKLWIHKNFLQFYFNYSKVKDKSLLFMEKKFKNISWGEKQFAF